MSEPVLPTRRTVMIATALGVVGVPVLAACGGGGGTTATPSSGEAIATLADLADGVPTVVMAQDTPVVLTRSGDTVTALSGVCTHQGCTVRNDGANLLCPCHGSMFGFDGAVTNGPATEPLPAVAVAVQGGEVVIA